ncbi:hypothetical protein [Rhizobium etli]|uniref:hypothetical protein n=1 Tax=Rhizobium etli TaxID=29449 RepID=UPI0018DFBC3E|nr:hypothetical protein [Rhizobium etli]
MSVPEMIERTAGGLERLWDSAVSKILLFCESASAPPLAFPVDPAKTAVET